MRMFHAVPELGSHVLNEILKGEPRTRGHTAAEIRPRGQTLK